MVYIYILAGILLFLYALIYWIVPYFLFRFIFYKPKRTTKIPKFYIDTPHYKVSRAGMEYMKTIPSEEVFTASHDGLRLHGYLYPTDKNPKKFIIGIHGYRSYARPEFAPYISFYHSLGYSMLLPDDRAHGPSTGTYIGFGVLDRLDCIQWANHLIERYGSDIEIILHGVSMGGATVIAASGEDTLPPQVKAVISDSGYTRAWDILEYELKTQFHLPAYPFLSQCEKICRRKAGFDFHEFAPADQISRTKIPVLLVHGKKDQMVPFYMAELLSDACNCSKKLLVSEEAGHGESIAFIPEEYHKAIKELLANI